MIGGAEHAPTSRRPIIYKTADVLRANHLNAKRHLELSLVTSPPNYAALGVPFGITTCPLHCLMCGVLEIYIKSL